MYYQVSTDKRLRNQLEVKQAFPNVAFTETISDKTLQDLGVLVLERAPAPEFNPSTHKLNSKSLEKRTREQAWGLQEYMYEDFEAVPLNQAELESLALQEQSRIIMLDMNNRYKRNQLLQQSDWTQMPDSPLSETNRLAWKTYRQALRDITTESGWPSTVVWPQPPNN